MTVKCITNNTTTTKAGKDIAFGQEKTIEILAIHLQY